MPRPAKGTVPPGLIPFTSERAREVALRMHAKRREELRMLKAGLAPSGESPNRLPLVQRQIARLSGALSNMRLSPRDLIALSNALDTMLERERILLGKPKPGTIHREKAPKPVEMASDLPVPE